MKMLVIVASVMVGVATAAQGVSLSPAEVGAAIEQGLAGNTLEKKCRASGENGFDIVVEGPVGRIMRAAREAKRQKHEFTVADVGLALDGPFLTVTARRDYTLTTASSAEPMPGAPGVWVLPEVAQADRRRSRNTMGDAYQAGIVLRSQPPGATEPILLKPAGPIVYTGAEASGTNRTRTTRPIPDTNMAAMFDLAAFRAMPPSTIDVVVFMTDAGEHRCRVSEKERQALR